MASVPGGGRTPDCVTVDLLRLRNDAGYYVPVSEPHALFPSKGRIGYGEQHRIVPIFG